jgi:hypothetical protein
LVRLARCNLLFRSHEVSGLLRQSLQMLLPFEGAAPFHHFMVRHCLANDLKSILEVYVIWYGLNKLPFDTFFSEYKKSAQKSRYAHRSVLFSLHARTRTRHPVRAHFTTALSLRPLINPQRRLSRRALSADRRIRAAHARSVAHGARRLDRRLVQRAGRARVRARLSHAADRDA